MVCVPPTTTTHTRLRLSSRLPTHGTAKLQNHHSGIGTPKLYLRQRLFETTSFVDYREHMMCTEHYFEGASNWCD